MLGSVVRWVRRRSPMIVLGYRSLGTPTEVVVRGRVLANRRIGAAEAGESRWRRVRRMAARFLTREVEGVEVEVTVGGVTTRTVSDANGYLAVACPQVDESMPTTRWIEATASLPGQRRRRESTVPVLVVEPTTDRCVISDIDDTVLENGLGDPIRTVWATFTGSALTRRAIEGMPELYRWLTGPTPGRPVVPMVYVSSSPWNLYDFLVRFLDHRGFPDGPLFLRNIGGDPALLTRRHGTHKEERIAEVLGLLPNAAVVLVGDSSQEDAAAFARIIRGFPGRVVAAAIRDVGDPVRAAEVRTIAAELSPADPPLILFDDPSALRRRLADLGWRDEPTTVTAGPTR